jgi:hypothetical protein
MLLDDVEVRFERGNLKLALRSVLTTAPNAIIITHGSRACLGRSQRLSTGEITYETERGPGSHRATLGVGEKIVRYHQGE